MEDIEKEILNRYRLWQGYIKQNPNSRDANESNLLFCGMCKGCSSGPDDLENASA